MQWKVINELHARRVIGIQGERSAGRKIWRLSLAWMQSFPMQGEQNFLFHLISHPVEFWPENFGATCWLHAVLLNIKTLEGTQVTGHYKYTPM